MTTIRHALDVRDRSVSFRDAEVLLAAVLDTTREYLHAHTESILSPSQEERFKEYLDRREKNEPVAYIIGTKEFYGRLFRCDKRALIPRPETEGIIDLALQHITGTSSVLELGTGTGAISVTLACELGTRSLTPSLVATDVSSDALALARDNWQALGKSLPIDFLEADLFSHPSLHERRFDLILANLPYVTDTWKQDPDAQPDVVFYEPDLALFGGADGLDIYRRFFSEAPGHLTPGGVILIEHDGDQALSLTKMATAAFPCSRSITHQDYAGLDRILEVVTLP